MNEEIIIAGFGGQGVLSMGKILAYSAIFKGKEVTWFPSYGPEMRGGTANVTVIISDSRISSPVLNSFDTAILLNQQSLDKFESCVKAGGILIYDPNGIIRPPHRRDIQVYQIQASTLAAEMGNSKTFNMIVMGAYLKVKPFIKPDDIVVGLKKSLPMRHHSIIPLNIEAVELGMSKIQNE